MKHKALAGTEIMFSMLATAKFSYKQTMLSKYAVASTGLNLQVTTLDALWQQP